MPSINPFLEDEPPFDGFPKDALKFLRQLRRNDNREWFESNRQRYMQSIRAPMESLLATLSRRLFSVDPDIVVEAKKAMYRIYRDIRFSKDKTPYKTHVAAAFTFRGKDRKTDSAFYFHFSPDELGIGGGLYAPESPTLKNIRKAIDHAASDFRAIIADRSFRKYFGGMEGEQLSRVPQGFDRDHPDADLLRMKQFLCWTSMKPDVIFSEQLTDLLVDHIAAMRPFVKWLAEKG